ncbi:MAG: NapC/NirT family cytochrome c [Sutterellaceae bacterium]|nr:NapC/NirT family cytochrome c [Sutterellaceae bacterium]MDD7441861.1 NapC/NirT family cytochrome c [Sutterellaceae bacterium]MDY2867711.1 NapC/NirT family cytochrome c [Mesosutterella sp.]
MKNCKKGAILVGLVGAVIGIVAFGIFNSVVHWAGSTQFCGTFCHSMDYVYAAYHQGQHAATPSGYTAGCSDCHLKYGSHHSINGFQYVGMLVHKAQSGSKSFFGQVAGHLNTFDKQKELAPELSKEVHEWMKSTGFANCRACHDLNKMKNAKNPDVATFHKVFANDMKADCLECHKTAGHDYKGINTQADADLLIAGKSLPTASSEAASSGAASEAAASEAAASSSAAAK